MPLSPAGKFIRPFLKKLIMPWKPSELWHQVTSTPSSLSLFWNSIPSSLSTSYWQVRMKVGDVWRRTSSSASKGENSGCSPSLMMWYTSPLWAPATCLFGRFGIMSQTGMNVASATKKHKGNKRKSISGPKTLQILSWLQTRMDRCAFNISPHRNCLLDYFSGIFSVKNKMLKLQSESCEEQQSSPGNNSKTRGKVNFLTKVKLFTFLYYMKILLYTL